MSQAYKCDNCGTLYLVSKQEFSLSFANIGNDFSTMHFDITVSRHADLCQGCVIHALTLAITDCGGDNDN